MTREEAFKEINDTQDFYVQELKKAIESQSNDVLKELNFTSDTGTGKTKMMAKLINLMPNYYFVVTTLSKGQLQKQIKTNLEKDVESNNFVVYGLCDFTANTRLQAQDILSRLPNDKKIIWLRDEGHINTNKWQSLINEHCFKIINISATNKEDTGIHCNFTNTMMLRTVHQAEGLPEEALDKLLEIKQQHAKVKNYNPCAIIRCLDDDITARVIKACEDRHLTYINITEENFDMSELCEDNNEYDVILNKFKIVEGIDLKRAHVLYMTNEPKNPATTIQVIGRCRRNALLYRNDIDILEAANEELLENTRQCFVYYNVQGMSIDSDQDGNLCQAFCDTISCEKLKCNSTITVKNGVMPNGLKIIELEGESGTYRVETDSATGFNVIKPEGKFYAVETIAYAPTIYGYTKEQLYNLPLAVETYTDWSTGQTKVKQLDYWKLPAASKTTEITIGKYNLITQQFEMTDLPKNTIEFELHETPSHKFALKIFSYDENIYLNHFYSHSTVNTFTIDKTSSCISPRCVVTEYFQTSAAAEERLQKKLINNKQITYNIANQYELSEHKYRFKFLRSSFNAIAVADSTYRVLTPKEFSNHHFTISYTWEGSETLLPKITADEFFEFHNFATYTQFFNDKESAIIGTDIMKLVDNDNWVENKAITSKIKKFSKLNSFISSKYNENIQSVKQQLFNGKNNFNFDSKCNSCLGYCVEYYSKYLIYGEKFLDNFIQVAKNESHYAGTDLPDGIIIRACMLKYKDMMCRAYGGLVRRYIKTITVEQLVKTKYKDFINTVIKLGTSTAKFISTNLKIDVNSTKYSPILSVKHISGLADYITEDTILDVKVTSNITIDYVKQVLAYHYLSTKRSDLHIKHVIVYEAVTGKFVKIDL